MNSNFTMSDSVYIFGKNTTTESQTKVEPSPTKSEVKSREVTKHDRGYLLPHSLPIYHAHKQKKYPERHF